MAYYSIYILQYLQYISILKMLTTLDITVVGRSSVWFLLNMKQKATHPSDHLYTFIYVHKLKVLARQSSPQEQLVCYAFCSHMQGLSANLSGKFCVMSEDQRVAAMPRLLLVCASGKATITTKPFLTWSLKENNEMKMFHAWDKSWDNPEV